MAGKGPEDWVTEVKAWEGLGATHLSLGTSGAGLKSPDSHIDAIRRFKEVV